MRKSVKMAFCILVCLALLHVYINVANLNSVEKIQRYLLSSSTGTLNGDYSDNRGDAVPAHLRSSYLKMLKAVYVELEKMNHSDARQLTDTVFRQISERISKSRNEVIGHSVSRMSSSGSSSLRNISHLPACPETPPGLAGVQVSHQSYLDTRLLEEKFYFLKPGGDYSPPECRALQRTAIVIPYRKRWSHLHILLNNLIPFLIRQQASFTIFVIEQVPPSRFNRAMLLNIGVLEALKRDNYTCFIFHDVDLVPLHDHNLYRCGSNPRHLAVGINKFGYKLPYSWYFGGAAAMSREQVEKVNGNSNLFFGWGGEDDDLNARLNEKGLKIIRYPWEIGRYDMIKHSRDKGNEANPVRGKLLTTSKKRMNEDGLNSARYVLQGSEVKLLYTWVKVSINETEILENSPIYVREIFNKTLHSLKPNPKDIRQQKNANDSHPQVSLKTLQYLLNRTLLSPELN